jgi:hypothetical protein
LTFVIFAFGRAASAIIGRHTLAVAPAAADFKADFKNVLRCINFAPA